MYNNYFKELEKYEEKEIRSHAVHCTNLVIEKDCCDNKKIIIDVPNNIEICESCGVSKIYYELEQENQITQTNPYYRLTSIIGFSYKYRNVQRLHKWNNYDYKENTAIVSYKKIREIGLEIKLNNEIINDSIQLYKEFYMDNGISTRFKIKKSLYIYCLFYNSFKNNFFDIFEILTNYNLTIDNFNKSIQRSNLNQFYLQQNMKTYIDIINKNYNIKFELKKIIICYNNLLKENKKLNNNSILILVFYDLLNIKNKNEFFNLFNISKSTIKKLI